LYVNSNNWTSQFEVDNEFPSGMPDHLLPEYIGTGGYKEVILPNTGGDDMAIYVKGGPVRVHGKYKGRYTIVTDEYTAYHRHAWGVNVQGINPIDTLWNNIWIIDDIVNNDGSANGSLINSQPDDMESCSGGSENVLGLVSGANVFIANTTRNGARDCNGNNGNDNFCNIDIHAHIIAFNESFAAHYSQNTYSGNGGIYNRPPYGDGQGPDIYGTSGTDDSRGTITLWGGIVQKFRGYVVRNNPGPYNLQAGNIGYPSKQYNFDCNLKCNYPPLYPENATCDEDSEELQWFIDTYE